jgi:hypothetical protein
VQPDTDLSFACGVPAAAALTCSTRCWDLATQREEVATVGLWVACRPAGVPCLVLRLHPFHCGGRLCSYRCHGHYIAGGQVWQLFMLVVQCGRTGLGCPQLGLPGVASLPVPEAASLPAAAALSTASRPRAWPAALLHHTAWRDPVHTHSVQQHVSVGWGCQEALQTD